MCYVYTPCSIVSWRWDTFGLNSIQPDVIRQEWLKSPFPPWLNLACVRQDCPWLIARLSLSSNASLIWMGLHLSGLGLEAQGASSDVPPRGGGKTLLFCTIPLVFHWHKDTWPMLFLHYSFESGLLATQGNSYIGQKAHCVLHSIFLFVLLLFIHGHQHCKGVIYFVFLHRDWGCRSSGGPDLMFGWGSVAYGSFILPHPEGYLFGKAPHQVLDGPVLVGS